MNKARKFSKQQKEKMDRHREEFEKIFWNKSITKNTSCLKTMRYHRDEFSRIFWHTDNISPSIIDWISIIYLEMNTLKCDMKRTESLIRKKFETDIYKLQLTIEGLHEKVDRLRKQTESKLTKLNSNILSSLEKLDRQ